MKNKYTYVTILSTESYLLGVYILYKSLQMTKPKYDFYCLLTNNISDKIKKLLSLIKIKTIDIPIIKNPHNNDINDRRIHNYSKLNMFNLIQFDKIVYLDADMIILHNIDELFEYKNMSAVNAGGMIYKSWKDLNSGLMVIEPSKTLFNDMILKVGKIEKEKNRGDQAFLHSYFYDWSSKKDLHLPHIYNFIYLYLENYEQKFNYYISEDIQFNMNNYNDRNIKVLHFIGKNKPWNDIDKLKRTKNKKELNYFEKCKLLWYKYYLIFTKEFKNNITNSLSIVSEF